MSKQITSNQGDILNTQNNVEETPKQNSPLSEREPIDKTPFWLITNQTGSFITFGEYRVSQILPSKAEALDELRNNDWNIIMHMVAVIVEKTLQEKDRVMPNKG